MKMKWTGQAPKATFGMQALYKPSRVLTRPFRVSRDRIKPEDQVLLPFYGGKFSQAKGRSRTHSKGLRHSASKLEMATLVKVYGPTLSTAVSRVLVCLIEKDVRFQLVPLNMSKGEHKKPDFLKIHPFGQVPAFADESISLFESRAICRYISEKHPERGNKALYGTNPLAKASIDQWLEAEGQSFNPPTSVLVFQLAFAPRMKIKQDEGAIGLNGEKLAKVLDVYDKRLGESRFLAGDEFSLADLSHLPNTQYLMGTEKGELFTCRKNVSRWWSEISTRDSWRQVVDMQSTKN